MSDNRIYEFVCGDCGAHLQYMAESQTAQCFANSEEEARYYALMHGWTKCGRDAKWQCQPCLEKAVRAERKRRGEVWRLIMQKEAPHA